MGIGAEALFMGGDPVPADAFDIVEGGAQPDRVATRATELDLPPALIAPRRVLEAIVREQAPPELDGWRREALSGLL